MMTFEQQMKIIYKAHQADFRKITFPVVYTAIIDPVDMTDILAVIKDTDINKYMFLDTIIRDACIEVCEKIIKEDKKRRTKSC